MIIKKFLGKSEEEALKAAKKELGDQVVLMNVKTVKKGGFLGFMQKQMKEVTVALEEESERRVGAAASKAAMKAAVSEIAQVAAKAEEPEKFVVPSRQTPPKTMEIPLQKEPTPPTDIPEQKDSPGPKNFLSDTLAYIEQKENQAIQEKLDSLQTLLEQKLQPAEEGPQEEESEMMVFLRLIYNTMLDNEVEEEYANQIMEEIDKINKPNTPVDFILSTIYQKMILKFGKPSQISPAEANCKFVFFIGPTGVGKTTTIAKVASKFCLDGKKKIAMLTCDTYRIAAAEQLRTYANILEIPFQIIYTADELREAAGQFKEYDYVFVDTAGHSFQNEEQKETVRNFVHAVDGIAESETYLVVSAATKYKDLKQIADSYKLIADYKLLFTKLDETTALGSLFSLCLYTDAPMSYVTYGQNVPDDIETFNPQKTVKQLLGGKR